MRLSEILSHSRPRFRLYVIGPFLLWYTAGIVDNSQFLSLSFIWRLVYFTLPANLLIYGANDIADYETDKNNPKKQSYESLLSPDKQKTMRLLVAITNIPFLIRSIIQGQWIWIILLAFRFFGVFYSSKPIRAKAIPFIDGIFNILYIIPWFLAYFLAGWTHIHIPTLIAGTLRCMAMHAYSAIPDIQADTEAKLQTTATVLGKYGTLIYCALCRIIASSIGYILIWPVSILAWLVYMSLIIISIKQPLFTIYKQFPLINAIIGMIIFFTIILA